MSMRVKDLTRSAYYGIISKSIARHLTEDMRVKNFGVFVRLRAPAQWQFPLHGMLNKNRESNT